VIRQNIVASLVSRELGEHGVESDAAIDDIRFTVACTQQVVARVADQMVATGPPSISSTRQRSMGASLEWRRRTPELHQAL
jgi:hypothetical protein